MKRSSFFSVCFPALICLCCSLVGQESYVDRILKDELFEFRDRSGFVIAVGRIKSLDTKAVEFVDGLGQTFEIKLADLNSDSRRYCVSLRKSLTRAKSAYSKVSKLLDQLDSNSTEVQKNACDQLAGLGQSIAFEAVKKLEGLWDSTDDHLALTAFNATVVLCDRTKANFDIIKKQIAGKNSRMKGLVEPAPEIFFDAIADWGSRSLSCLKFAAFTGSFSMNGKVPSKPNLIPVSDLTRVRVRSAACRALGKLGPTAKPTLIEVLRVAEKKINGRNDLQSVQFAILGLGRTGVNTPDVQAIFRRYKNSAREFVLIAENECLNRARQRSQISRLKKGFKMRYYVDSQGNAFFRGLLNTADEQNAIFYDENLKLVSIPISKFSDDEKMAIKQFASEAK